MSINAISLLGERAIVAADSWLWAPGEEPTDGTKLFALPHANAVLTGRGMFALLTDVFVHACSSRLDLDGLLVTLPTVLPDFLRAAVGRTDSAEQSCLANSRHELLVAGWSRTAGEMAAMRLTWEPNEATVSVELPTSDVTAWEPSLGALPPMRDIAEVRQACALAHAWHARFRRPVGFGGQLVVAELTCDGINVTSGPFPQGVKS